VNGFVDDPWNMRPPNHVGVAVASAALIGVLLSFLIARDLDSHVPPFSKTAPMPAEVPSGAAP
jgi:hypothetical protein